MLGDLRILAAARTPSAESCCSTPSASALQALFDMIRRFKVGYDVELHKRTLERGLLSLIGPDARAHRRRRARCAAEPSTRTRRVEIDGIAALVVVTDVGVDLVCDAERRRALARRAARPRRAAGRRGRRPRPARRARPAALRRRPRRHDDPAGGRPQRARGQLHEGLLRRPGDGRAPVLQGQAEPPPARPAAVRAGADRHRAAARRARRRRRSAASSLSPALGPIALALVRREAPPGDAARRPGGERRGRRAAVLEQGRYGRRVTVDRGTMELHGDTRPRKEAHDDHIRSRPGRRAAAARARRAHAHGLGGLPHRASRRSRARSTRRSSPTPGSVSQRELHELADERERLVPTR